MKSFRKILSLLLGVLLMMSLAPAVRAAGDSGSEEEAKPEVFICGDYTYTLREDDGAVVTGWSGKEIELTMLDALNGHPVREVGIFAFSDCTFLISVTIPEGVTSIGDWAFSNCTSLTSVNLPNSVIELGINPFAFCENLAEISIAENHPSLQVINGVLFSDRGKTLVSFPCNSDRTEYRIPNGVTSIGSEAFSGCSSLTSVTIPDSVTAIGNGTFSGCSSLTSVMIPDSVTSIGADVFWSCFSLTSVVIPDGVTSIGDTAFWYCSSLSSVTIPDSVISLGNGAFSSCKSLTSVTIPNSVASIGNVAFSRCPSLSLSISDGNTYAQQYAKENDIPFTTFNPNIWTCSNGHKNPLENLFCNLCGEKQLCELQPWTCSNGHENTADNLFCPKCGEKCPD